MSDYGADMAALCSTDGEQSLLGVMMFDPRAWPSIEGRVHAGQFRSEVHGRLFKHAATLLKAGQAADPSILHQKMGEGYDYHQLGGRSYLLELIDRAPPSFQAAGLASLIADLETRRRMVAAGHAIIADAKAQGDDGGVDGLISRTEAVVADVQRASSSRDAWEDGAAVCEELSEILAGNRKPSYVPTGIPGLDAKIGGFRRARFTILGGRPSMGKSAVAVKAMKGMAQAGLACAMFSLEMDLTELALRMGCSAAFDPYAPSPVYFDADRGTMNDRDRATLMAGGLMLRDLPISIDTRSGLKPSQIVPAAKRIVRQWEKRGLEPGAIFVDHIHIVRPDGHYNSRTVELAEISGALRDLARDTGVAIIGLCQLSRELEGRGNKDKRPQLSDLRWSGELEQDANSVIFIHRPEKYIRPPENENDLEAMIAYQEAMDQWQGKTQFLIEKHRGGPGSIEHTCRSSLAHNAYWEIA